MTEDPQDPHRRAKQVMQTPGHQFDTLMHTLAEAETLLAALVAYRGTLPPDSAEAQQVTNRLDQLSLSKNIKWCIVADTSLTEGRQTGKRLLTFADGTRAIFKPASGEGGRRMKTVGNHS
jgi:hypothetical protein